MSATVLQLNFNFNVTAEEYTQAVAPLADQFAALDGLIWKVWMINPDKSDAGGIYLFEDRASAKAYLEGELAASVIALPALSDFDVKLFDVMDEVTAITRGPVG